MNIERPRFLPRVDAPFAVFAVLAISSHLADRAAAQSEIVGVDTESETLAEPPGLPGHEKRPEKPPAAPAPPVEPLTPADSDNWFGGEPWWRWPRATGDWGGLRDSAEQAGLTIDGSFTLDWSDVLSGGLVRDSSFRTLLDATATLDLDTVMGLRGGSVFVNYCSINGDGGSLDAGDFQGISNIQSDRNRDQVAQLWYSQELADGALLLKFGKIDANSEFGYIDSGVEFMNSSAAMTPTNFALPTYPDPAVGATAFLYPVEHLYVGAGVFDGSNAVDGVETGALGAKEFFSDDRSDDYYLIAEAGLSWDSIGGAGAGSVIGGIWRHTGEFSTFDDGLDNGTNGFYLHAQQVVCRRSDDPEDDKGLSMFGQFGWADEDVSDAAVHLAAGLSIEGTFPGRDDDAAGLYVSWVDLSDKAGYAQDETALELFYRIQLTPFMSLKPDIQWVINPSGDESLDDAVVAGFRFQVGF